MTESPLSVADVQKRQQSSPYRPYSLPTLSRNLTPFVIPLLLRLLARRLRQDPLDSDLLAEHYAQQDKRLLSSFFLTGPMWVGWTRPKIMGIVKGLERIPIVGLVGEFVEGYLPLVDDYFYCTSDAVSDVKADPQIHHHDEQHGSYQCIQMRGIMVQNVVCNLQKASYLRFIKPFWSHLPVSPDRHMRPKAHFGIFFSPSGFEVCPVFAADCCSSFGTAGGKGTIFSNNASSRGAW